jgi:type I restriction enzyme S subunit
MFLRAGHVTDSHIDFEGVERFHAVLADKVQPKMARAGDTIITTKGNSTGRTSFVTERMPSFVYSPHLSYWRSRDSKQLANGFLRYWSRSSEFVKQLSGMKASTDMAPYLSLTDQRRLRITLPPPDEQQAIACILGSLDDKIELTRRMNRTLEGLARALFQSWFVDFDPVRAKAAGKAPDGLAPHVAKLFPDAFEDSELGEIPQGWRMRPIGDVVQVVGGGTPSTKQPAYWVGGTHPFCTPKDMSGLTSPILLETERRLTDAGLEQISSGQLPVGTVLLSSRAPIGYLAIAETPVSINQGIIAMICDRELPNVFVLYWCQTNMDRVIANANGSTFLEISKVNFRPIEALIPTCCILEHFHTLVSPIRERVVNGLRQSRHLAAVRDALLPKLISSELRVPDAERIVERATA